MGGAYQKRRYGSSRRGREKKEREPLEAARESALLLLRYRDRSVSEMSRRLKQKGYADEIVEDVIGKLSEVGLLDDSKFAALFARSKIAEKSWGPAKLRNELYAKGIAADLIDATIASAYEENDQRELASGLLNRRLRGKSGFTREEIKKHTDFLRRRGFSWDVVSDVIKEIKLRSDDEEN